MIPGRGQYVVIQTDGKRYEFDEKFVANPEVMYNGTPIGKINSMGWWRDPKNELYAITGKFELIMPLYAQEEFNVTGTLTAIIEDDVVKGIELKPKDEKNPTEQ